MTPDEIRARLDECRIWSKISGHRYKPGEYMDGCTGCDRIRELEAMLKGADDGE